MFIQTIKRKYLSATAATYRYCQWRRTVSLTVLITFFSSTVSPAFAADPATVTKNKTSSNKVNAIKENIKITKAKQKKLYSYKAANSKVKSESKNSSSPNEYKPYLEFGGARYFNQASNVAGIYDLFIPLLQNSEQLLFTDLRIFDRSGSAAEGNFHLGYRKLIDPKQLFGIYGAFDYKRSNESNSFHQLTLGLEYWHDKWFAGANIYQPIGVTKKYVGETTSQHELINSSRNIVETKTTNKLYEEALPGIDAELGFALTENLTSYVGGYYFAASGAETVTGPKVRVTYDYLQPIGRILGIVDGISVEAGAQHDKPRGNTAYVGLRFKVGLTNLAKNSNISGFKRHMVELVRRDPDIVIGKIQETSQEKYYQKKYYQEGEHGFVGGAANPDRPYRERTDYENWPQEILLKELGLPTDATYAEIGKAYREISLMHHPDKTKRSWDNHARINGAYTELKNRHHAEKIKNQADQQKTTASQGVILNLPTATTIAGGNSYEYYGGGDLKNSKAKSETPNSKQLTLPDYKYSNFDVERLLAYRLLESKSAITAKELPLTVISPVSQTDLSFSHNPQLFGRWLKQEFATEEKKIILPVYLNKEEHWVSVVFAKKNDSALEVKYLDSLATQENSHSWLTQLLKNSYDGKINFVQEKLLQQSANSAGCGAFAIENALRGLNLFTNNINANQNEKDIRNSHQSLLDKYKNQKTPNQGIISFIDISAILPIGISINRSRTMRGGRKGGKKLKNVQNEPPVVDDLSKGTPTNTIVEFSTKDFADKFDDPEGDDLVRVKVTSLPSNGILKLFTTDVTTDQEIVAGDLGDLTFEPEENWLGDTSFGWKGHDGYVYSTAAANVNITIVATFRLVLVGSIDTDGNARGVAVAGDYAYVVDGGQGLKVIHIATPTTPELVGSLDTDGTAYGVAVVGDYAYVADGDMGLKVINIATPTVPDLVGSVDTDGDARGVAVAGDYAYVADGDKGLKVINIATSTAPELVGSIDTDGTAYGVAVAGDYAYMADGDKGLKVINIATPTAPELVGSLDTDSYAWGVAVAGDYAYVADESYFELIKVVTPTAPKLVSSVSMDGYAVDVAVAGDYAYVADYDKGLEVINVVTSAAPVLVGSLDTDGFAWGVAVEGDYVYVADGESGFKIIKNENNESPVVSDLAKAAAKNTRVVFMEKDFTDKFTDPNSDSLVKVKITSLPSNGTLKLFGSDVGVNQKIVTADLDHLIFEPGNNWTGDTSFSWKGCDGYLYSIVAAKVNIAIVVTLAPVLVGSLATDDTAYGVAVAGNYTYVADGKSGLKIIDVISSSAPKLIGSLDTDGHAWGVVVGGDYAYVADGGSGLKIINIAAPASPELIGSLATDGSVVGVVMGGEYVYVADYDKGLKIINITTPATPGLVGSLDTDGHAWGVAVGGDYAYVADGEKGLKIINITTPTAPELVGSLATDGNAAGVAIGGDYAYIEPVPNTKNSINIDISS